MTWERIWGPTATVVVDGETASVFALPHPTARVPAGVYRWTGAPSIWTPLGLQAVKIVTAGWSPHSHLFALDGQGVVQRWEGQPGAWAPIGGPSNGKAQDLFGGPDQLLATAIGSPADVYRWDEASGWTHVGGPGKTFVVGKSSDPEFKVQVYGQSPEDAPPADQGIYQWSGGWYRRGGAAGQVFVSGTTLFATSPATGDLMMLSPTGWKHIGGPGRQFALDAQGHVFGLSTDGSAVYRWTGTPNSWERIGGAAGSLFAGWDRLLFATNPDTHDLYAYRPTLPTAGLMPDFSGAVVTGQNKPANVLGQRRLVAVLWDPHRPDHPAPARHAVEDLLFGPKPSVRDWLAENSAGRASLVNAGMLGWYDAPAAKQGEHYWDNPDPGSPDPAHRDPNYHQTTYHDGWLSGHAEKWADAIRRAGQDINFATLDADADGVLTSGDAGVLVCIPQNTSYGTNRPTVGQQVPGVIPLRIGGVEIPEVAEWYLGDPPDLGTAIHELAHLLLRTPDLYFVGHWPYAAGSFSNSDVAALNHLSAPEKLKMGWLNATVVLSSGEFMLNAVEAGNDALLVVQPAHGPNEYFLLENRWRAGSYDAGVTGVGAGIPADGLAVWHVVEDPSAFNAVTPFPPTGVPGEWGRLGVRLIRANGGTPFDDHHALFSAGAVISDVTSPAALHWIDGSASGVRIEVLSGPDATIRVRITM